MSLTCPLFHAKPKNNCSSSSGKFARPHVVRIAAVALLDAADKKKRKNAKSKGLRPNLGPAATQGFFKVQKQASIARGGRKTSVITQRWKLPD